MTCFSDDLAVSSIMGIGVFNSFEGHYFYYWIIAMNAYQRKHQLKTCYPAQVQAPLQKSISNRTSSSSEPQAQGELKRKQWQKKKKIFSPCNVALWKQDEFVILTSDISKPTIKHNGQQMLFESSFKKITLMYLLFMGQEVAVLSDNLIDKTDFKR